MSDRRSFIRFLSASGLTLLGGVTAADSGSNTGVVEVWITDHKPGIDQFSTLDVTLQEISLHQKGAARTKGWVSFSADLTQSEAVDIVPLKDGRYFVLGQEKIPTGLYDALKIRFSDTTGALKTKATPVVLGGDTTVSVSLIVDTTDNLPIVIDLYVEDQTEHDPPVYVVKVKEIRTAV